MTRRRPHPPASPRDAERDGDVPHFSTVEDLDAFFNCRHNAEPARCLDCKAEAAERRAEMEFEAIRDEGGL